MQECAPGDKGGAAIGFAKMRFAIFLLNHCNCLSSKRVADSLLEFKSPQDLWCWELFALPLKALNENHENLDFLCLYGTC